MHVHDEVAVYLQFGERHRRKQPHRRDARAEVVHRQLEAAHPQQVQAGRQRQPVGHGLVFGQLHLDQPGRQPRLPDALLQQAWQVARAQRGRGCIDGDGHGDVLVMHLAQHFKNPVGDAAEQHAVQAQPVRGGHEVGR
ncbi:hypothetical protein D3C72_1745860 [compost metagenome]